MPSNKELRLKVVGIISSVAASAVLITSVLMLSKVVDMQIQQLQIPTSLLLRQCSSIVQQSLPRSGTLFLDYFQLIRTTPALLQQCDKLSARLELDCGGTEKYGMLLALSITGIVVSLAQIASAHIPYFIQTKTDSDNNKSMIRKFSSLWMFTNMTLLIPHLLLCILTFYYGQCNSPRSILTSQEMVMAMSQKEQSDRDAFVTTQCQDKLCNMTQWLAYSNCLVLNLGILFVLISYAFFNIVKHIDYKEAVRQERELHIPRHVIPNHYTTALQ